MRKKVLQHLISALLLVKLGHTGEKDPILGLFCNRGHRRQFVKAVSMYIFFREGPMSVNFISLKLKVLGLGVAAIIGGMTLLNATTCGTGFASGCDHDLTKAQTIETSAVVKTQDLAQKKG